jgi:hypothetical protein
VENLGCEYLAADNRQSNLEQFRNVFLEEMCRVVNSAQIRKVAVGQ